MEILEMVKSQIKNEFNINNLEQEWEHMLMQFLKHQKYEEESENQVHMTHIKQELMSDGRQFNIGLACINGPRKLMCFMLIHWFDFVE